YCLLYLLYLSICRTNKYTLFPYTTLFRSIKIYKEELDKRSEDYSALSAELEAARSSNEALQEKLRQQGIEKEVANSEVKSLKSEDRKSTRLNSSHVKKSYAVFCLKKKRDK